MTKAIDSQFDEDWSDDELDDTETDMKDTDDLDFDDFDGDLEETSDELQNSRSTSASSRGESSTPLWRLIEMSRESRRLLDDLADFEDYEFYDSVDGDLSFGASH